CCLPSQKSTTCRNQRLKTCSKRYRRRISRCSGPLRRGPVSYRLPKMATLENGSARISIRLQVWLDSQESAVQFLQAVSAVFSGNGVRGRTVTGLEKQPPVRRFRMSAPRVARTIFGETLQTASLRSGTFALASQRRPSYLRPNSSTCFVCARNNPSWLGSP